MSRIDYLIMICSSIITVALELFTYAKASKNKFVFDKKSIVLIVLTGIFVTFNIYTNGALIRALLSFTLLLICALLLFGDNVQKTTYYTIVCYIIATTFEILLSILLLKINIISYDMVEKSIVAKSLFSFITLILTYFTISISYVNKFFTNIESRISKNRLFIIIFGVMLAYLFIVDFRYILTFSTKVYIGNIVLLICIVFLIVISIRNYIRVIKETEKTEYILDFMTNYEKIIDEDRVNRHEMLNNLLVLKTIKNKNSKDFEDTLNELIETYNKNGVGIKNVHKLPAGLKGIFYYKLHGLEEKGFNINISISNQVAGFFKKFDHKRYVIVCKMVGILLDNAIEASEKSKEKLISIETYKEGNKLIIVIDNTFSGNINLDKISEKYYSTKGKGRGLGLYLVSELINKTDNIFLDKEINNNIFTSKITILKK